MADFVGKSRHPTNFGLKELLWDSDEDGFWEYFSKFEEESCWACPLSFDVPNTTSWRFNELEYRLLSHAPPLHLQAWSPLPCPLIVPCPDPTPKKRGWGLGTRLVLSDIPNENTPTGKPLNDEDLDRFIEQQKNQNTKCKTESDIRKWYQWCEEYGGNRQLKDELNRLLAHFFIAVRRKDDKLYEPDTLTSFQRNIDRHFTRNLRQPYSILRDQEFTTSRDALKAAPKCLKSEGKGSKPNAANALESVDIERMWSSGALGDTHPLTLQQTLWWLIAMHMGTRGRDEHHKLWFGDFTINSTTDGHEYIEFNKERGTKARTGETEKSTNADARAFKPKMWATLDTPSRCPVRLYRAFI